MLTSGRRVGLVASFLTHRDVDTSFLRNPTEEKGMEGEYRSYWLAMPARPVTLWQNGVGWMDKLESRDGGKRDR